MASVKRTLSVIFKDSLFDPDSSEKIAQYREQPSGQPLYRVFLYLDGPDLPFVESVTFRLHETFSPPTRRVTRSLTNPHCKIAIWTWGVFTAEAVVVGKTGGELELSHRLQYGNQISNPDIKFKAG